MIDKSRQRRALVLVFVFIILCIQSNGEIGFGNWKLVCACLLTSLLHFGT